MKEADLTRDTDTTLFGDTLVCFVEALNRMFKIGIYYPVGHVVLDQSASTCIQQLRIISSSLPCVKIAVDRNTLFIEKWELPETSIPVREFHMFLSSLGVESIEIQRNIPRKHLLHFITILLDWRMQLEGVQGFVSFNLSELPESIKVEQHEFLVDETLVQNRESADEYQLSQQELWLSLAEQGLSEQQIKQCKELLEKLSKVQGEQSLEIVKFPNATWHDVEALLFKIVTGAYSPDEERFESVATHDINALTSIFESLENSLSDKKSKETIKLLLSHLKRSGNAQPEKLKKDILSGKTREQSDQTREMISVEEVKSFIFENNISLKVLEKITSVDRSEEVSILYQLIYPGQDQHLFEEIERRLEVILVTRLSAREKCVVLEGLKHLADLEEIKPFQQMFTMISRILRDSDYLDSLDLMIEFWKKVPRELHTVLWSHLVNELLVVGIRENKEGFIEVTDIAARMHIDTMSHLRFQLEELEAFQDKKVAPVIFRASAIEAYRLFALLLATSLGTIVAEKVLSVLKETPQDPLIEGVGPLLDLTVLSYQQFLSAYLSHAHLDEFPLALRMAAGEIVLAYLQNISPEEKSLPWLSKTIASTSGMHAKGMKEMLERIVKEKKMGVVSAWPKNCRKVAKGELKALNRLSLRHLL